MNPEQAAARAESVPRWLPWVLLPLLTLPFHPFWIDFEQVRRGLLLVLTGACLVALPRLPAVRGERWLWVFVGSLVLAATVRWIGDAWFREAGAAAAFQPWEALYRVAHWLALWVVLRLGAALGGAGAVPLAALLLASSSFGLLQRVGLAEFAGYGVEREPVSVFGNLNVASEFTAIAAAAVAAAWPKLADGARRVATASLLAAGAYLVVNQSRSGLVALPIALVVLAVLPRRPQRWLPLALAAGGALLGLLVHTALTRPEPANVVVARSELQRSTSTLAVRWQIAKGTTQLWAESPVVGLGPGQFAIHYPRVRSQDEIEASSHGRRFATEVRTAHDDWLELLIDGGALALVAFVVMLFSLQRAQPDKAVLVPMLALLLLMLVRAPLWNAPAAVAAFWFAGVATTVRALPVPLWRRLAFAALGLAMVALGALPIAANCAIAPFQRARHYADQPPTSAAAAAAAWMPFEPRWHDLLAQLSMHDRSLQRAAQAALQAIKLRPFHPNYYLLLGEINARRSDFSQAITIAKDALRLDPPNPELRMLLSASLVQHGDVERAIDTLVDAPHPTLREHLARHFAELANVCTDPKGKASLRVEHHFLAILDRLGNFDQEAQAAIGEHLRQMTQEMQAAGPRDARPLVLGALYALDLGDPAQAIAAGKSAARMPPLTKWQRELLGAQLDRLRALESWQPFLGR